RYRSLREDAVGRISVAPSGTKTGTVSAVSCPAALRLPGLGYRSLWEAPVGRISVAPSGTKAGMGPEVPSRRRCACRGGRGILARRRCACRAYGIGAYGRIP
ncbi:hypothetical protein CLI87_22030, partial [Klebsiella pneumoniae]